jgi:ribonuclease BN (tRNA processing enzyme)
LFWYNSEPLFLIDIGGDTPTALSRAGVKSGSIAALLISHVHPDHVSGLADYLWGEMTADRSAPLAVIAPSAGERFLDAPTLFHRLFGPEGVYPDMQSLMSASPFPIRFTTADALGRSMLEMRGFAVTAMRVDHGRAPALAFRIDGRGYRVVFAGDQRASDPTFLPFASEADILVVHAMATEAVTGNSLSRAIAAPTDLGQLATRARAKHVVLSHLMQSSADSPNAPVWSLSDLTSVIAAVRSQYQGPISVASDLECFPLRRRNELGTPVPIR